ncbi:efflux transporter outer membrane subunit [Thermosulfuriphilus sp.]
MRFGALILFIFLFSCSPRVSTEQVSFSLPSSFQHAPKGLRVPRPPDQWWKTFGDPRLDRLVEEVLEKNLDLKEALASLEELRSQVTVARSARFPRLDFNFQGRRERNVILGPFFARSPSYIIGRFNVSLAASYEVDLWQRLSKEEAAARMRLLEAQENRLALAQSLVAEAVSRYLKRKFLLCELLKLKDDISVQRKLLGLLKGRYQKGLVSAVELKDQEALLREAEAEEAQLREEIQRLARELAILKGAYPEDLLPSKDPSYCGLELPPVPSGLPSELLERRPDIRAAWARVLAAEAEVASARAARLPRISLTGDLGRISIALKDLLRPDNRWWQLAVSLGQPLFDAGGLKAQEEAARFRAQAVQAAYIKTVLQAFYEVETALAAEESLSRGLQLLLSRQKALCEDYKLKERRYRLGLIGAVELLRSKGQCLRAQKGLYEARASLWLNRVSLYRALGGAWPELESGD